MAWDNGNRQAGRTCLECGASIEHRGAQARYCDPSCSNRTYRRRHRAKVNAQKRAAHHRHRDANDARSRERYRTHRDEAAKYMRLYYQRNRDARLEAQRLWGLRNRSRAVEAGRIRRARQRSADIRIVSERDWERLVRRYGGMCAYCGTRPWEHRYHLIPIARGGRHSIGNLLPACATCNCSKKDKTPIEYRRWLRVTALAS
jgi:HNH endonuclease